MRLAVDSHRDAGSRARRDARRPGRRRQRPGRRRCSTADQSTEAGVSAQRARVAALRSLLADVRPDDREARRLAALADVSRDARACGSSAATAGRTTSATAGSITCSRSAATSTSSCSTPRSTRTPAASSRRRRRSARPRSSPSAGKATPKKDLGLMAMAYGHVYVARVAFGAKDAQTVKAFIEAEAYPGTSLIIAYSHCIAHGYDLASGLEQQKLAVDSGHWPLFRFDPRRAAARRTRARSSTRARRRSSLEQVHAQRIALPHGRAGATRRASRCSLEAAKADIRDRVCALRGSWRGQQGREVRDDDGPPHDVSRIRRCRTR